MLLIMIEEDRRRHLGPLWLILINLDFILYSRQTSLLAFSLLSFSLLSTYIIIDLTDHNIIITLVYFLFSFNTSTSLSVCYSVGVFTGIRYQREPAQQNVTWSFCHAKSGCQSKERGVNFKDQARDILPMKNEESALLSFGVKDCEAPSERTSF